MGRVPAGTDWGQEAHSVSAALNQENKHAVWEFWKALEASTGDRIKTVARDYLDVNFTWNGFDPVNKLQGVEGFVTEF